MEFLSNLFPMSVDMTSLYEFFDSDVGEVKHAMLKILDPVFEKYFEDSELNQIFLNYGQNTYCSAVLSRLIKDIGMEKDFKQEDFINILTSLNELSNSDYNSPREMYLDLMDKFIKKIIPSTLDVKEDQVDQYDSQATISYDTDELEEISKLEVLHPPTPSQKRKEWDDELYSEDLVVCQPQMKRLKQ